MRSSSLDTGSARALSTPIARNLPGNQRNQCSGLWRMLSDAACPSCRSRQPPGPGRSHNHPSSPLLGGHLCSVARTPPAVRVSGQDHQSPGYCAADGIVDGGSRKDALRVLL